MNDQLQLLKNFQNVWTTPQIERVLYFSVRCFKVAKLYRKYALELKKQKECVSSAVDSMIFLAFVTFSSRPYITFVWFLVKITVMLYFSRNDIASEHFEFYEWFHNLGLKSLDLLYLEYNYDETICNLEHCYDAIAAEAPKIPT